MKLNKIHHVAVIVSDYEKSKDFYVNQLFKNYGSLFMGKYSAVVYSDYVNGINHTLPTGKAARYSGGVWIGTFSRVCTTQRLTKEAAHQVAALASHLAEGEGFPGHANAAAIRLKS